MRADCQAATPAEKSGTWNGITINAVGSKVFARFGDHGIREYNRDITNGALTKVRDLHLPSTSMDNLELDEGYDGATGLLFVSDNGRGDKCADPTQACYAPDADPAGIYPSGHPFPDLQKDGLVFKGATFVNISDPFRSARVFAGFVEQPMETAQKNNKRVFFASSSVLHRGWALLGAFASGGGPIVCKELRFEPSDPKLSHRSTHSNGYFLQKRAAPAL